MIHYAAQKGRTKISCRQRTVFRIRILLLENHSGYVASVLQLPAYLTTYHTPGRHGRVPAEYLDYLSTSLTFSPAALVLLFTVPVKGAWRLDWDYYMSLYFMRQPYFGCYAGQGL